MRLPPSPPWRRALRCSPTSRWRIRWRPHAQWRAVVSGRKLDDDGSALFQLANGARGTLTASQVCTGDLNDLTISIWCEEAGLHWKQEEPNALILKRQDKPAEILTTGTNRP